MAEEALPCIVCGKPLRNVFPDEETNQPSIGVMFSSPGNYGSTVWDEMFTSQERLQINVCDTCLLRAGDSGRVLRYRPKPTEWISVPWAPDPDRHHTLSENEKLYGAWGDDEPYAPAYEEVEES